MLLEVGKTYLDRSGSTWKCVSGMAYHGPYTHTCVREDGKREDFTSDGRWSMLGGADDWDIIKEKPMQLEAGKYYKTRDGRKAFVAAIVGQNPMCDLETDYPPACGFIGQSGIRTSWRMDGWYFSSAADDRDLVSEWIDSPQEIVVDGVTYVRKAGA